MRFETRQPQPPTSVPSEITARLELKEFAMSGLHPKTLYTVRLAIVTNGGGLLHMISTRQTFERGRMLGAWKTRWPDEEEWSLARRDLDVDLTFDLLVTCGYDVLTATVEAPVLLEEFEAFLEAAGVFELASGGLQLTRTEVNEWKKRLREPQLTYPLTLARP